MDPSETQITDSIPSFLGVRACIFDMDGLLINSEDIITSSADQLLVQYWETRIAQINPR